MYTKDDDFESIKKEICSRIPIRYCYLWYFAERKSTILEEINVCEWEMHFAFRCYFGDKYIKEDIIKIFRDSKINDILNK